MITISIAIVGLTPLLCGRPSDLVAETPEVQARAKLYLDATGQPVIPGINLLRCFQGAARRDGLAEAALTGLAISQQHLPIHAPQGWVVDSRLVRGRSSGERIPCHRPRFDAWYLQAELLLADERIAADQAQRIIASAGLTIGLGDFRPERGGPFGRFRLAAWSIATDSRATPRLHPDSHHALATPR
jgi:hypothetical protein